MRLKLNFTKPQYPIMFLMIGYFFIAIYLAIFLKYDFFRSDVGGYWQDSLEWQTPFNIGHVPAYPLMIAILRGITFGALHPVGLMMSINLSAFLASSFIIYKIIQKGDASDKLATLGTLLFGLWPFVGLTYTVNPLADMPAMFFLLGGLLLLQHSCRLPAAFLLGLSLVTHKAMWIFVGLLLISEIFQRRGCSLKQNVLFAGIIFLPIGILWISGFFYHHSIIWIFPGAPNESITSTYFGGLLRILNQGEIKDLIKGILMLSLVVISIFTLYMSSKIKYEYFHYGAMISLAIFLLLLLVNQYTIWAVMRFGRLLVVPLAFIANTKMKYNKISWWSIPATIAVLILLFLSQFVYSWYWACVYFG